MFSKDGISVGKWRTCSNKGWLVLGTNLTDVERTKILNIQSFEHHHVENDTLCFICTKYTLHKGNSLHLDASHVKIDTFEGL